MLDDLGVLADFDVQAVNGDDEFVDYVEEGVWKKRVRGVGSFGETYWCR